MLLKKHVVLRRRSVTSDHDGTCLDGPNGGDWSLLPVMTVVSKRRKFLMKLATATATATATAIDTARAGQAGGAGREQAERPRITCPYHVPADLDNAARSVRQCAVDTLMATEFAKRERDSGVCLYRWASFNR